MPIPAGAVFSLNTVTWYRNGRAIRPTQRTARNFIFYRWTCSTQNFTILFWDWGRHWIARTDPPWYTSVLSAVLCLLYNPLPPLLPSSPVRPSTPALWWPPPPLQASITSTAPCLLYGPESPLWPSVPSVRHVISHCFVKWWCFWLFLKTPFAETDHFARQRFYTSTKLIMVNYCLYSFMHKKKHLYLNNI